MQKYIKAVLFIICLLPFIYIITIIVTDGLGANPIEELTHFTGTWALNFLLITLSVTPVRKLTRVNKVVQYRRMLGLYAFFYAFLHFLCYIVLDQFFDLHEILNDVIKRPYITIGFSAFLLLIPLAVTSTKKMMVSLGKKWAQLHKLIYISATLAILHFLWLVKADIREPVIYGTILVILLFIRFFWASHLPGNSRYRFKQ
jgi:methionine sulfoxide reductase heme-binding subunit